MSDEEYLSEQDNSVKSFTAEPEMEDFNDTLLLKNLISELGIEESLSIEVDFLKHDSSSPQSCAHCKLVSKLISLQADITKMNQEIGATHEILNLKKEQNSDLKGMIRRLQGSLGKTEEDEEVIDRSVAICSCTNKCFIS